MIPNLAVIVATYAIARLLMLGMVPFITKPDDARVVNALVAGTAVVVVGYYCIEIVNAASNLAPALGV